MTFIKKRYYVFLVCIALILSASHAFAADDGLSFDKKIEGKYTIVYYPAGLDVAHLVQQLNIRPSDKISVGESLNTKNSYEEELTQMLDTLFLQVSDILEMHLYNLKINIKVFNNNTELGDIYSRLFKSSLGGKSSFYASDFNSIYVSGDGFNPGIIGHEMSHAIICHYFPTPVPIKIQELLAMYTEYSLRKVK
jgi:hypothetical protein